MRGKLRTLRNTLVHSGQSLPARVLRTWAHGAQDDLIADATIASNRLFFTSCALQRHEVSFGKIKLLMSLPKTVRANSRIDEDGTYLH